MSGTRRPPNELESRLHQAALAAPKQEITPKQAEAVVPDPRERQNALNFLLGVGLFKSLKDPKGNLLFRAVSKGELVATKDLSGEENLVLSHIKNSGNEGIWTKHLKAKTNLHQTIIDRCLKTLIQKRLIKRVPSVQHPTRKIYMLEGLEPSIALTGGPWYTDNELDTEFIQHLMDACYKFISDISFPKRRDAPEGALFPISNAPDYPSAQHIRNSLRKARLTETDLSVEHVESLLNVLVLDGKIEALPAFGTSLWDSAAINEESDDEDDRSRKKRKYGSDDEHERKRSKRKRSKRASSSDDESLDDHRSSSKKKSSKRHRSPATSSDAESEEDTKRKKRKSKKRRDGDSDDSDSEAESRPRSKKKRKKRSSRSSDSETSSESESDHRSRKSSKRSSKRSPSPFDYSGFDQDTGGGGLVYRALKEYTSQLGWAQAPCALCPSFDFCKAEGPVNPQECDYYDEWLAAKPMTTLTDSGIGI
ncbi:RNA polymerase III subunit Rpc34 [Coprinopsis cinerea okayama7|uniref:RNA polymerase III subunit Rpc34 n=1 Tax=Coprinopsis cinerea (strain Okayama-7 / 130 / ATCC MYA-4618 / FGSC 9003) TaxID=240176 RepID=A8NWQ3_COPC7|nr:RNA polymerase III subunit Rpc34 [Coprinopsis cinerea okayama7\|eukprot:XP_001836956.2 RNA polymerase III subunit Rpc34 [Coprinopsis cinerea okayama7\